MLRIHLNWNISQVSIPQLYARAICLGTTTMCCLTVAAAETVAFAGSFTSPFCVRTELSSGGRSVERAAAHLLHPATRSAQHSIVQIWSGGSEKGRWRNPRCCCFKWLQETRAPTHVMGFPLYVPQQQDVLNMGICLLNPPPPPFSPHPFLPSSLSLRHEEASRLGEGWDCSCGFVLKGCILTVSHSQSATRWRRRRVKGLLYIATDFFFQSFLLLFALWNSHWSRYNVSTIYVLYIEDTKLIERYRWYKVS